jgi:double-stranded uracil-DNA glycosylase
MARPSPQEVLAAGLRVLLVAINPAPASARAGQPFSSPGNPFWALLHASGLTPRQLAPAEAPLLPSFGLGLTSLVPRPTAAAAELGLAERRAGAASLRRRVARWRPRTVGLLGLTLFPVLFPGAEEPGPGWKVVRLAGAPVFVLPNPSGRNLAYPGFEAKLRWYRALAEGLGREAG